MKHPQFIQLQILWIHLQKSFLQSVITRVKYYKVLADKTFDQLGEKEFYYSPNEASNSIAIIIQHMSGNMLSRWTNFFNRRRRKALEKPRHRI